MATEPIRVRMYNVGFGDCFLIFIPTPRGVKKVAIDCGSLKNKKHSIAEIADRLIADVTDPGDNVARIDVLIMSHRHADHISGYTNPKWSQVEVGEVWMPWLESRENPAARAIQRRQRAAALALADAVRTFGLDAELTDVAFNAQSNDDSLDILHRGFSKRVKPRFFPSGESVVERISTSALPEVEVYVMGPPHDRTALNRPDPPEQQVLLTGYREDSEALDPRKFRPFGDDWEDEHAVVPDFDPAEVDNAASKSRMYELAAAALDAEINNTSLILLFRVGENYLLFPGDAQWGPWEKVLANEDAVELLEKVTFMKISHHGSHNGSPKTLLEDILGRKNKKGGIVQAMISMTPYSRWKHIPHQPLLDILAKRNFPYVISDKLQNQPGFKRNAGYWFEAEIR